MLRSARTELKKNAFAYRFVLPYVLFLCLFVLYPIVANLHLSLQEDGELGWGNYRYVLSSLDFATITSNTIVWTVGSVFLQSCLGLGLALLLNQEFRGRAFFRAIILVLPWATPDIVVAVAWQWMYNDMYGVINDVLFRLGLIDHYLPWLAQPNLAKAAVIIANTWKGFALSAMFYLAALQTVPHSLYEAAEIDGAGIWRKFTSVTWPVIRPFIVTTLMLTTIWTINYFPLIYTMTGGGPANATDTFVTYSYRLAFRFLEFERSAALSTFTFVIILIISTFYTLFLLRRGDE
ncbi:MAG: sugar ABC transporter permease [Firmicutes bacterium]|nr:sugar ABC transporter permease [Bacillota bacterium]